MKRLRLIAWWVWENEWIPLGPLAPYWLGFCLGSMPRRVKR